MAKVRVQDATKELSANTGRLLDDFVKLRRQSQDVLSSLKRISDGIQKAEREKKEQEAQEALNKQIEASAGFMTSYSTEKAPEVPAEPVKPAVAEPVKPVEKKPEAQPQGDPQRPAAQQARPAQGQRSQGGARPAQGAQQGGENRGPYGRPVQGAQQGQRPQGPYGRPAQQGGPYGRPAQGGQQGSRPQGGAPRPQGGAGARPGAASGRTGGFGGRRMNNELTPSVEKERVSNYDPNKKNYVRQNDPERNANKNARRSQPVTRGGYMDDDVVRGKRKKKGAQQKAKIEPIKIDHAVMTAETITVKDLTERIGKPAGEIIKKLMMLGIMATINQELDFDTAQLVASEFDVTLELKLAETAEDVLEAGDTEDAEEDLLPRPPVVTIMGHVDHGKTSLLDYIRKTRVTAGEAGGITQHIGAYTVDVRDKKITFLDTPGHEAFTAMRMRGAQVTDIAILVVAADDGVMPQTIEAINHAKAAGVTTMVAINKIDKVGANVERIRQQLTEYELVAEEWGGDTIMVPVSAHTGEGIDQLLDMILLVAEVQDYKANPNRRAKGTIVEARLDKGRGPVATVLVQNGTLNVGDAIIAGTAYGRVRAMVNDRGERVKTAGPSDPVEVIGFNDVPNAGDIISAVDDDRLSRQVAEERKDKLRAALVKNQSGATLEDLFGQITAGQVKDLNLIIKADVQGSVQAVKQSLERLTNEEVRVRTIHGAAGAITESDVMLASASKAIVIGFNVKADSAVTAMAEREGVDIRLYTVIYNAIEDVEKAMKGLLDPKYKEVILGHAEVRQVFKISGAGQVAGSYVLDGKLQRGAGVRVMRDGEQLHEGKIESLKRFKDDAREVAAGYECGVTIGGFSGIKEGDTLECFQMEEITD
ncbi:MAG: translation initiation factor IF-2 [Clostridia bacterium]|nr:translation initiation factor IF-2 [Clostridia bacterium]